MLETALKFIHEINSHGYKAYIVGGFVRDHILGIESHDIDINTNATPKEIKEIELVQENLNKAELDANFDLVLYEYTDFMILFLPFKGKQEE